MKTDFVNGYESPFIQRSMWRSVRIVLFMLFVSFHAYAQAEEDGQKYSISVACENGTLEQVINMIEKQSSYLFVFNDNVDIKHKVSIKARNSNIEYILDKLFEGTNITYQIDGDHVLVYKALEHTGALQGVQQAGKVKGVVVDENGEPVIGVNVSIKNTTTGTITDIDGTFSLDADPQITLIVSYVGYVTREVKVNNRNLLRIILKEDTQLLDDVVVIGYGTVKKRDLTGSVATISGDNLKANPVVDISQAIQGRLAGVVVTAQDGRPGASIDIRVRGGGSVTQSNAPLYIVDGMPVESISDIPASQIKSIDVLKDASSTAIYGARGANGVILVTTNTADGERSTVTYEAYMQVKSVAKTYDVLDAQDYVLNTWSYAAAQGIGYQRGVEEYFGLGSSVEGGSRYNDYANMSVHNYTDDLLHTVITQSHNLSINGAGEKTKYLFMVNYLNDPGIKINSSYDRINATLKLNHQLFSNFKVGFDVRFTQTNKKGNEGNTILSKAFMYKPIDNPLGNGNFAGFGNGDVNIDDAYNPVDVTNSYKNLSKTNTVRGLFTANWEIIKGLTVNEDFSINGIWGHTKNYNNGETSASSYKYGELKKKDGYSWRNALTINWQVQGLGDKHDLSLLVGNENLYSVTNENNIYGTGYASSFDFDRVFGMINMTDGTKDSFGNTEGTPNITRSFFGRINYSYLDRYLLTATFRTDGSSKFAQNNRWGYFPAAAFAWRIIDEPFMQSAKSWLDYLKLRFSYGTSGSDNISSQLWEETWTSNTIIWNNESLTTYAPAGMLANPDLKWETTISRNFGLDFGFLNNRLSGSLDFYWNTTKDLLIYVPIDASTGYTYQYQNIGRTSNKGMELALNYDIVRTKNFNLNIAATYNYNHNNIDELNENVSTQYNTNWASSALRPSYDYEFKEGKPVGVVRGFINDGFYTLDDFIITEQNGKHVYKLKDGIPDLNTSLIGRYYGQSNFTTDGCSAFPGAIKLRDADGNGTVDEADVVDLGEVTPKHTGGLNINMTYKNFDFSAGFTYAIGGKVYNALAMSNMYGNIDNSIGANRMKFIEDTYKIYDVDANGDLQPVTDPASLAVLNAGAKYALPYYERGLVLSNWVEDASYLRLNTLTVGYTLPTQWVKKIGLEYARFYVTGGNLFCITGYSGLDPEVNTNGNYGGFPTIGLDYYTYPRSRTFTVGLKLTL